MRNSDHISSSNYMLIGLCSRSKSSNAPELADSEAQLEVLKVKYLNLSSWPHIAENIYRELIMNHSPIPRYEQRF